MKTQLSLAAACLSALIAYQPAFAADEAPTAIRQAAPLAAPATDAHAGHGDMAMDMERKFVMKAWNINQSEIEEGKLAQERAKSADVKQYAMQMVKEHQEAQQQLEQMAMSAKMDVPKQLNEVHQAMLNMLQKEQGKDFERSYVYGQVAGHTKAALIFRDAASECTNDQLKQYAQTVLPKILQHNQHVQRLAGMGENAMPAGATERGSHATPAVAPGGAANQGQPGGVGVTGAPDAGTQGK